MSPDAPRDERAEGFAHSAVPTDATGSSRKIFFIVVGSLCGLPALVLSSKVAASLGFRTAVGAFLAGGCICAVLGAFSAMSGARTRMSLALIAKTTFGGTGASVVQLAIALSAIGWFTVIVSVLGATACDSIFLAYGIKVPSTAIAIPLCILITLVARRGAGSMHKLGAVIVPLTVLLLAVSVIRTHRQLLAAPTLAPLQALSFGSAVSAVVGNYIVGIIIQPDYGRFVRRPNRAAFAAALSLGVAYPAILVLSAVPSVALGQSNLISALIALGLGIPALALLLLGAWIDASSCLYSGSLALANLIPRVRFGSIVVTSAALCTVLAFLHVERHFLSYLQALGTLLPPLAAVQCTTALWPFSSPVGALRRQRRRRFVIPSFAAWAIGVAVGLNAQHLGWLTTHIAVVDSVIAALVASAIILSIEDRMAESPVLGSEST